MYKKALYAGDWAEKMVREIGNHTILSCPGSFSLVVDRRGALRLATHDEPVEGNRMVFRFRGLCIGAVLEAIPSVVFYGLIALGDEDGTRRTEFMRLCLQKHREIQGAE